MSLKKKTEKALKTKKNVIVCNDFLFENNIKKKNLNPSNHFVYKKMEILRQLLIYILNFFKSSTSTKHQIFSLLKKYQLKQILLKMLSLIHI